MDILRLGIAGIFFEWTLQGYLAVGYCRDILQLDTAGIILQLGIAGILCVGHYKDT